MRTTRGWTAGRLLACLAITIAGNGCSDPPGSPPGDASDAIHPATGEDIPGSPAGIVVSGWDREIVFLGSDPDDPVYVAWHVRAGDLDSGVRWERTLRVSREARWEGLLADTLETPGAAAPGRLMPGGPLRIVVEAGGALGSVIYRAAGREIEVRFGEFLVERSRPGGGSVRVSRGTGFLAGEGEEAPTERAGLLLDLTRPWDLREAPPGDWAFLESGAGTQLFLEEVADGGPSLPDPTEAVESRDFRGWSRVAFQAQMWPEVQMAWEETRAFEPARRDIPRRWSFSTPDARLEGEFETVGSHLAAGVSAGPLLPLTGYFEVRGEIRVDGETIPVRGIVRHVQE